jgi:peptidoglycan hydrolase-like protein with peptidoglycan-binding domain
MMRDIRAVFLTLFFTTFLIFPATQTAAQQQSWVQVESLQSLVQAQSKIRRYAASLEDVTGFATTNGRYAIALGPYSLRDALQVLQAYKADGVIPRDSFIATGTKYKQQFWPVAANTLPPPAAEPITDTPATEPDVVAVIAPPEPEPRGETKREALASERLLSREQRQELQVALKWAGVYDGAIDGDFGRGTRGAMAQWQAQNNFTETGVLTTFQRSELMRQYNAVFEGLGLERVDDTGAGISMILPTRLVKFDRYAPPFAHYNPVGDLPARVILISEQGTKDTLAGLYDIMQTLEIVPPEGPREIKDNAFTLVGENAQIVSQTQAWLEEGEIKGFTLIWPAGDEPRRQRLIARMLASFERLDGVIDPALGAIEEPQIDLLAGLEIRKPKLSHSGFYVDQTGAVITSDAGLSQCARITIDEDYEAEMVAHDAALGIALLRPKQEMAPLSVATFQPTPPRLQSEVAVAGYSYGGILGAPTLSYGTLADLRGLRGEPELRRLALAALEGDVGGPVLDASGAVLGMLLPDSQNGRKLPEGVSFAAGPQALMPLLQQAGVSPTEATETGQISPEVLARQASDMTVLVSCWE